MIRNHLSKPVILLSLAATLLGTYFFWKLLEALQHRGIYTMGHDQNGQGFDTSIWVVDGLVVFFVLLIVVVSQRTRKDK